MVLPKEELGKRPVPCGSVRDAFPGVEDMLAGNPGNPAPRLAGLAVLAAHRPRHGQAQELLGSRLGMARSTMAGLDVLQRSEREVSQP